MVTLSRAIYLQALTACGLFGKGKSMDGKLRGWVWMALVVACTGCTMCQAPYDYCAATVGPDGLPTGGFMTRKGSVLGGMPGVPVYQSKPTLAAGPAEPTPASAAAPTEAEPVVEAP